MAAKYDNKEGEVYSHNLVDILFSPKQYTSDLPYLIAMIIREIHAGMFLKLDPEGVNTSGKNS